MSITRSHAWLAALGISFLLATAASAQSIPEFVPDAGDFQWFDQPEYNPISGAMAPNTGWWGSAEVLVWAISPPDQVIVGNPAVPFRTVFGAGSQAVNTGPNPFNPATFDPANPATFPSAPGVTSPLGAALINAAPQSNTTNSGFITADMQSGSRYEFGYVRDNFGWMVSTFQLFGHTQDVNGSNLSLNFENGPIGFLTETRLFQGRLKTFDLDLDQDGVFGSDGRDRGTLVGNNFQEPRDGIPDSEPIGAAEIPTDFDDIVALPTVFDSFTISTKNEMWGAEAMAMYRYPAPGRHGGIWEFFAGPRYINFLEEFNVFGDAGESIVFAGNLGPTLGDTYWETQAENNLVGAQMAYRWHRQNGRLRLMSEGRLLPAANFQSVRQQGVTQVSVTQATNGARGTRVINIPNATAFNNSFHETEFSMVGELRFNMSYQLFRQVYLQAGWTGMYMDGLARPSQMIRYRLPDFGIDGSDNRDNLFTNGLDFGIVINR